MPTGSRPPRRFRVARVAVALALLVSIAQAAPPGRGIDRAAAANDRLPDLQMASNTNFAIEESGGRRLLRFTAIMWNAGSGPLEVLGSRPNTTQAFMTTQQRIHDDAGGSRLVPSAARMQYAGDGHDHWHVQQIMSYDLWSADATRRVSTKVGFCYFDTNAWNLGLPGAPRSGQYPQSGCGVRGSLSTRTGISVGWGDEYAWNFVGQWIDITGLPAGAYTVRSQVDAYNHYLETNDGNNCTWASVTFAASGTWVSATQGGHACPQPPSPIPVQRLAGPDRYATAAAISAAAFSPGVPIAFLATGRNFPDALAGVPAAATLGGPVLLVTSSQIPAATATELARLRPAKIIVLGSAAVISDAVATYVARYQTGGGVGRLAGADRYETAAAVSRWTFTQPGGAVYVASGENFPDALAAGAAAGRIGASLLLTRGTVLPPAIDAEIRRLAPSTIIVVGSAAVVSEAVVAQLRGAAPAAAIGRLGGADRYHTAALISHHSHPGTAPVVYVAVGTNFPDALAGGPAAARQGAPMLLVRGSRVPSYTADELRRLDPGAIVILGSAGVISEPLREEIQRLARL